MNVSHVTIAFKSRDSHMTYHVHAGCLITCHTHCMEHIESTMVCNPEVSGCTLPLQQLQLSVYFATEKVGYHRLGLNAWLIQ